MSNQQNILIVDDDPDIRMLLKLEAKKEDHHSFSVATANGAIGALKKESYDWVLLDIMLSDGNETSLGVLQFLKSEENITNKNAKVIIISGKIDSSFQERNKDKVTKIISKPFSVEEIYRFIDQYDQ